MLILDKVELRAKKISKVSSFSEYPVNPTGYCLEFKKKIILQAKSNG